MTLEERSKLAGVDTLYTDEQIAAMTREELSKLSTAECGRCKECIEGKGWFAHQPRVKWTNRA